MILAIRAADLAHCRVAKAFESLPTDGLRKWPSKSFTQHCRATVQISQGCTAVPLMPAPWEQSSEPHVPGQEERRYGRSMVEQTDHG